jgi:SMI1 / KNR4 family (SUKH-1)
MNDSCLTYFRDAAAGRAGTTPWDQWWRANECLAEKSFGPTDYQRLRKQGLMAARMIVRRTALPWSSRASVSSTFGSPAISDDNVAAFERDQGFTFPADYREFLLSYNGGRPRPSWFRMSGRDPADLHVALFCHLYFDPNLPQPRCAHTLQFAARPPADHFPIGQSGSADDSLLLIKFAGQQTGAIFLWPDKARGGDRPAPILAAASFDAFMKGLDYPEQTKPWMELIDRADVDGFSKWLDAGPDWDRRDPASGFTPIEYAAWGHDPDVPLGDLHPEDVRLRRACLKIVETLLVRGALPGRAIRRAFFARNHAIVKLLLSTGLDGVPTKDLEDVRYYLRHRPAWADDELRPAVERELKTRRT